jgi:DNA gyrase/topoisomerase IV subunit A
MVRTNISLSIEIDQVNLLCKYFPGYKLTDIIHLLINKHTKTEEGIMENIRIHNDQIQLLNKELEQLRQYEEDRLKDEYSKLPESIRISMAFIAKEIIKNPESKQKWFDYIQKHYSCDMCTFEKLLKIGMSS